MLVQALHNSLQAVWEWVETSAHSFQLGQPLVQAIAGPSALPNLCDIVASNDLDFLANISKLDLRVISMLCQLLVQIVHLVKKCWYLLMCEFWFCFFAQSSSINTLTVISAIMYFPILDTKNHVCNMFKYFNCNNIVYYTVSTVSKITKRHVQQLWRSLKVP